MIMFTVLHKQLNSTSTPKAALAGLGPKPYIGEPESLYFELPCPPQLEAQTGGSPFPSAKPILDWLLFLEAG